MAVEFTQDGPGVNRQAPVFGHSRRQITGSVDAAGDIADIWDTGKGGLKHVDVVLFDGAGLTDYDAKTVAGGVYPQRFIAFGR